MSNSLAAKLLIAESFEHHGMVLATGGKPAMQCIQIEVQICHNTCSHND